MRVADLPFPHIDEPEDCDTGGLHVVVNIFFNVVDDLWDSAKWDQNEWTNAEVWMDIAGDVRGVVVERLNEDANEYLSSAHLSLQLDNSSGKYSQFDDQGNQATFAVGGFIAVWLDQEWKFYGRITRWEENYGSGPHPEARMKMSNVEVEAYDSFFLLNQGIDGLTYPIGNEGDTTGQRLVYLASLAGFRRGLKLDRSITIHRSQQSTNPVLETMQKTAQSDGGMLFIDNDGQLMFLNQSSTIGGRSDQPDPIPTLSDACEEGSWDFWEGDPVTDDTLIRNDVILTNLDGIQVRASDQLSIDRRARRLYDPDGQTWTNQTDAQKVAYTILALRSNAYFHVDPIVFYGDAPLLRIGDVIRYKRELSNGTKVDADLLVIGESWDYAPGKQVVTITTAPVTNVNAESRWDSANWDIALWTL